MAVQPVMCLTWSKDGMIFHDRVLMYFCLLEDGMIRDDTTIRPKEATEEDLRVVHTKRYINSLRVSNPVSCIYKLYLLIFHHDYVFVSHIRRKPISNMFP